MYKHCLLFFLLLTVTGLVAQETSVPAASLLPLLQPGAAVTLVSKQFTFTEGPAVDKKGNIFFTDQPNDKIWKYDTDGNLSVYMDKTGRSNGLYFDVNGRLISCADEDNQLWAIDASKKITVLLKDFHGTRLNGPNDLWVDAKGGIYFTDPYYQRDYWQRKKPDMARQDLYYIAKGKQPVILDSTLKQPNGIVGTPDGKYLYVADIGAWKTYKYEIGKDGRLTNRQLFASVGSDGMTLDEKGNVYLSGKGVTVLNSAGVQLGNISVPSNWVGNICFGGKDRKTLFITASESVYTLQMQVRGVE